MAELAYSLHLGSDKNRKNISKQNGKNNLSKTTSLPNNAIQNVRQLSKVDKHNYRKYDNEQELIEIIRGTSSPLEDVKQLYLDEFEDARLEYNSKQSRHSRMIDNYFDNVSNNEKKDLACEIIIELGDKEFWDTKDDEFKSKMSEVYRKQVNDLELLVPNFKVASAIIHYDETSPHMHIVGVPIKYKNKNGMEKQVGKSDVFTKESLITLQNKMRTLCIEEFNQEYNLDSTLKKKQKGRNMDIHVSDMDNYIALKKQLEKNNENLEKANKKSLELKQNSKNIKEKIETLKVSKLNKDNYILSKEDNIERIYINFCNPWPRGKHHKKRLTHTRQLEKYKEFLVNGAKIYFKTDDDGLFNDSIKYFEDSCFRIEKRTYDLENEIDFWENIETEHEKMFKEQGIKIKALIASIE